MPKASAKVEKLEGSAGCIVLQTVENFVIFRVPQEALLDEPELAYTRPRENLPGLLALSFESVGILLGFSVTHISINVLYDFPWGHTTPVFQQFSKGRRELVFKGLSVPG